ncbi:MAG: Crp/Fnr family transcriptional regulator [Caulobacteraceae bacterium]|nr:Crp/Fnr family transcriptional regulator [Caulobacteraceae bacterium]
MTAAAVHPSPAKQTSTEWRACSASGLSRLAPVSVLAFAPEETIYAQEQDAEFIYEVILGVVRTVKLSPDGRRLVQSFVMPGEVFGLEHAERHGTSAEAVNEVWLMRCERGVVQSPALADERAPSELWALMLLAAESARDRWAFLARASAMEKVAFFLLEMTERAAAADRLDLAMSRYDIADYLGLTSETVSRTLTQLRQRGSIAIEGRSIRLLRPADLRRISAAPS